MNRSVCGSSGVVWCVVAGGLGAPFARQACERPEFDRLDIKNA